MTEKLGEIEKPRRIWPFALGFVPGLLTPFLFFEDPMSIGLFSLLVACFAGGIVVGSVMTTIDNIVSTGRP